MENAALALEILKKLRAPVDKHLDTFFKNASKQKLRGYDARLGGEFKTDSLFARVGAEKICAVEFIPGKVGYIDSMIDFTSHRYVLLSDISRALLANDFKSCAYPSSSFREQLKVKKLPPHKRVHFARYKSVKKEASYFIFDGGTQSLKGQLVIRTKISASDSAKLAKLFKNKTEASKSINNLYKKLLRKSLHILS